MVNRMGRLAAKMKAKRTALEKTKHAKGHLKSTMKSSWVEYYEWVPNSPLGDVGDFYMKVKGGKKYSWANISREEAGQAVGGNAECTTDDTTGARRWWKGKHPSLGAAYHQVCKYFTSRGHAAYNIMDDVEYDPTKKYVPAAKGRPTAEMDRWKRFSKLRKYRKGVTA